MEHCIRLFVFFAEHNLNFYGTHQNKSKKLSFQLTYFKYRGVYWKSFPPPPKKKLNIYIYACENQCPIFHYPQGQEGNSE